VREAVKGLAKTFGSSEFYYQDAISLCGIDAKVFAKLRTDGILIRVSRHWPARWRIADRYLEGLDWTYGV